MGGLLRGRTQCQRHSEEKSRLHKKRAPENPGARLNSCLENSASVCALGYKPPSPAKTKARRNTVASTVTMKKKYGKFYARWTGADGKRHEKAFDTKKGKPALLRILTRYSR
jgi:hypothetical protein